MRERPILMSAPMVLACRREVDPKTQTRRPIKPQPGPDAADAGVIGSDDPKSNGLWWWLTAGGIDASMADGAAFRCPYGVPGDRLWVREAWKAHSTFEGVPPRDIPVSTVFYMADDGYAPSGSRGRPGMFMPRWASRLTLEVTEVRVERLLDCSEADALAEGVVWSDQWQGFVVPGVEHPNKDFPVLSRATAREMYAALWDTINGSGAWLGNPWVWAVSFKRVEA